MMEMCYHQRFWTKSNIERSMQHELHRALKASSIPYTFLFEEMWKEFLVNDINGTGV